jgi:hypothetical protein
MKNTKKTKMQINTANLEKISVKKLFRFSGDKAVYKNNGMLFDAVKTHRGWFLTGDYTY